MASIRPFNKLHLADQLGFDPAAALHVFCSEGLATSRAFLLRQVFEGAVGNPALFRRENILSRKPATKPFLTLATKRRCLFS